MTPSGNRAPILPQVCERQRWSAMARAVGVPGRGGWTCKSTRQLPAASQAQVQHVSYQPVARLLHHLEYTLPAPRTTLERSSYTDRDAELDHLDALGTIALAMRQSVILVDEKRNVLLGPSRAAGSTRQSQRSTWRRIPSMVNRATRSALPLSQHDYCSPYCVRGP